MITRAAFGLTSLPSDAASFSVRNTARTITAVIESGSGVTSVRPRKSLTVLRGESFAVRSVTMYSV